MVRMVRMMDIKLVEHSEHSGSVMRTAPGRVCDSEHLCWFFQALKSIFSHCLAEKVFTFVFTTTHANYKGMSLITFPI